MTCIIRPAAVPGYLFCQSGRGNSHAVDPYIKHIVRDLVNLVSRSQGKRGQK